MKVNLGGIDRMIRLLAGLALLGVSISGALASPYSYVPFCAGIALIITMVVRLCPLYSALFVRHDICNPMSYPALLKILRTIIRRLKARGKDLLSGTKDQFEINRNIGLTVNAGKARENQPASLPAGRHVPAEVSSWDEIIAG